MSSNTDIVTSLIKAICANKKADILAHFNDDAVFHNIPLAIAQGHEAIWEALAPIHDIAEDVAWQVYHSAETPEGIVLNERIDRYRLKGQWIEFKVMGIFEIKNGKIQHWRDYFDLQQAMSQFPS